MRHNFDRLRDFVQPDPPDIDDDEEEYDPFASSDEEYEQWRDRQMGLDDYDD